MTTAFAPRVGIDPAEEPDDCSGTDFTRPEFSHVRPAATLAGIDLAELDGPPIPIEWLVEGRVARASLTLVGAKPATGKSWLCADLALAVVRGAQWLGHNVPRPGRVLYLDAESGTRLALRRLQQLGALSTDTRLHYVTDDAALSTGRHTSLFQATLDQFRPDLVVVDTLASVAVGRAEADVEAAARFLADVWQPARAIGAAMVITHHLRKSLQGGGRDDLLDSFRGSGHLTGAASRAWILDPRPDDDGASFVMKDVKAREWPANPDVMLHIRDHPHENGVRTSVSCAGAIEPTLTSYDRVIATTLAIIDSAAHGSAPTKDVLQGNATVAERTVRDYLKRARQLGVLQQPLRGYWSRSHAAPAGT